MRRIMEITAVAGLALLVPQAALADAHAPMETQENVMAERQTVLGFGGFFFRSDDPGALAAWYEKHLGINPVPTSYDDEPWMQEAGPTVFAPMPAEVPMIPEGKSWMINLRVADLNAMAAQLEADGISVTVDPETYPNGRFATLYDPEGNAIQLWEPMNPEGE